MAVTSTQQATDPRYGFNAESNKRVADVTGYSGQFGNGDFEKWLQTDAGKQWAPNISNIAKSPSVNPVATYTPETYAADKYSVNADTDTTQGQLKGLLSAPNPIMQLAQNNAMQMANSRGLLNSSLAASAGEKALIESAMPIAQSDANAYLNTGQTNTAAANAAKSFNANASNQSYQTNAAAQNAELQFARNVTADRYKADQSAAIQNKQIDTNVLMNSLDNKTKNDLAKVEADYKTTMQSSASATTMYQTAMQEIGKINASTALNATSKKQSIDNITNNLKDAMAIISKTSNIDVSKLLNFSNTQDGTASTQDGATSTSAQVINQGDGTQESPYTSAPLVPKGGDYVTQNGATYRYVSRRGPLGIPIGGDWVPA